LERRNLNDRGQSFTDQLLSIRKAFALAYCDTLDNCGVTILISLIAYCRLCLYRARRWVPSILLWGKYVNKSC
jgi:hypothetical protein